MAEITDKTKVWISEQPNPGAQFDEKDGMKTASFCGRRAYLI
jgi:hypothetical protein